MEENIKIKDFLNELNDIRREEKVLYENHDTYESLVNERVRISNRLKKLLLTSQLDEKDFITLKNAFNINISLEEKPYYVKEFLNELKDIREEEDVLAQNDDTYEYVVNKRVRISNRLKKLLLTSQLDEKDFITLKNAFNITISLEEKPYYVDFFSEKEDLFE